MDPALIAAVVPAAITAAGTVLAALIRARCPVLDESRRGAAAGQPPGSGTVIWSSGQRLGVRRRSKSVTPGTADELRLYKKYKKL